MEYIILGVILIHIFNHHLKHKKTMATLQDVQTAIDTLTTHVDNVKAAVSTEIETLKAQIAAGGATPEDLQGIVDRLTAVTTDVDSTQTS